MAPPLLPPLLLLLASSALAARLPSWQQPLLDPLVPPYGGAQLLSNRTRWTRLFYGSLAPGAGAYAMSPMLSFLNGRLLASWKLSVSDEDEPGQRVMWAQSDDGVTWTTASDGSNELFPSMNASENPRVALFAEPSLLIGGRVYAAASPTQFCLFPDQYQGVLLLRRVFDDRIGHFGPIFWAANAVPPGFAEASARENVTTAAQQDAQTRADIATLTPAATAPPCALDGSTSKCEFCTGGCQDWAVALNVSSLENERSHWRVPGAEAEVLLYRSHNHVLYASVREAVGAAWPVPAPTNITDDVANFNAGNFPQTGGLDGRAYLVSNALLTLIRDPLFLSTAPDGYAFTTVAAIGSCEDSAVFASPEQPWGCQYRVQGGAKEGGLQYPQAAVVTAPASVAGLYVIVSLNKEDIWVSRTPLEDLPRPAAAEPAAAPAVAAGASAAAGAPPPLSSYYVEADLSPAGDAAFVVTAAAYVARWAAAAAGLPAPLPVVAPGAAPAGAPVIAVGFVAAARLAPTPPPNGGWAALGAEGYVLQTGLGADGASAAALGADGAPRGTLYAAYALVEALGVRHWAPPNATSLPAAPATALPAPMDVVFVPPLEYRSTDNWQVQGAGFGDWSAALRENDASDPSDGQAKPGGGVAYAGPPGFGNNAATWVSPDSPPGSAHPEWFGGSQQLCFSEPTLVEYLIVRAREFIAQSPNASILTLAQNDNQDYCKTPAEQAIIDAEGGAPSGPLLRAINAIAANVSADFPGLAIDTLAYQYTRKAPNTTRPLPNVIVRLCNIECNFRVPLSDPLNAAFAADLAAWAAISRRLYIWDYIVNFANTVMPFPNIGVLAPNIRFLLNNSVRGIFEEGQYWSYGGELQELRSYLVLRLMYDPTLDEATLMRDFLGGFYGEAGAPAVAAYISIFEQSAADTGVFLGLYVDQNSVFLTPSAVLGAIALLRDAAAASAEPFAQRLRVLWLAPTYVALLRWSELSAWAAANGVPWPLPAAAQAAFDAFSAVYTSAGLGAGALSEGGHGLAWLQSQLPPAAGAVAGAAA